MNKIKMLIIILLLALGQEAMGMQRPPVIAGQQDQGIRVDQPQGPVQQDAQPAVVPAQNQPMVQQPAVPAQNQQPSRFQRFCNFINPLNAPTSWATGVKFGGWAAIGYGVRTFAQYGCDHMLSLIGRCCTAECSMFGADVVNSYSSFDLIKYPVLAVIAGYVLLRAGNR